MTWTADEKETLRGLWGEGHSMSEIGRRMGKTKNQVVGQGYRMGLPKRGSPIIRSGAPRPWHVAAQGNRDERMVKAGEMADAGHEPKDIAKALGVHIDTARLYLRMLGKQKTCGQRRAARRAPRPAVTEPSAMTRPGSSYRGKTCQWPIGQVKTPGFRFCGDPAVTGRPYCGAHCARAYARGDQQEAA